MSDECDKVPSFFPGRVIKEFDFDTCQDGARFLFSTRGPVMILMRVKPLNETVNQELKKALESGERVVIGGYPCTGIRPDCARFDCYVVTPAESFAEKVANL